METIFLSASIPQEDRDGRYYETADVIAIREAVRALATTVIPKAHLIWGGHPSITPLIRDIVLKMDKNRQHLRDHVTLYQSEFYKDQFPEDNLDFEDVQMIPTESTKEDSELAMRLQMLDRSKQYAAGIFIGGMEGVEKEYELFREFHPKAKLLPVASTGGAALFIFEKLGLQQDEQLERLKDDYAYASLFRDLIGGVVGEV